MMFIIHPQHHHHNSYLVPVNFAKYENSSFGMKMDYPADWKKAEDNRGTGLETEMSR